MYNVQCTSCLHCSFELLSMCSVVISLSLPCLVLFLFLGLPLSLPPPSLTLPLSLPPPSLSLPLSPSPLPPYLLPPLSLSLSPSLSLPPSSICGIYSINKLMNSKQSTASYINQFLTGFNIVKTLVHVCCREIIHCIYEISQYSWATSCPN